MEQFIYFPFWSILDVTLFSQILPINLASITQLKI